MELMLHEPLTVQISAALKEKLARTAQEEGVSIDVLAQELLAEGVVLRAWEIIERKSAMRGNSQPSHHHHQQQHRPHRHGNGGGHRRHQPNGNWMEDRAAFLEYVRNQEKAGR
jgi:hypothetical protein